MEWIFDNMDWIFSGIGIFILAYLIKFFKKKNDVKKTSIKQRSGSGSTNIQIGGDYNGK